jgi:hypothetical protein
MVYQLTRGWRPSVGCPVLRRRGGWFTIVATDLFSSAFAAIILLDTVSPKEIGSVAELQEVRISYPAGETPCSTDPDALVFSFRNGGEIVTTLNKDFEFASTEAECVIAKLVEVHIDEIDEPCILIAELARPIPEISVSVSGVGYDKVPDQC